MMRKGMNGSIKRVFEKRNSDIGEEHLLCATLHIIMAFMFNVWETM